MLDPRRCTEPLSLVGGGIQEGVPYRPRIEGTSAVVAGRIRAIVLAILRRDESAARWLELRVPDQYYQRRQSEGAPPTTRALHNLSSAAHHPQNPVIVGGFVWTGLSLCISPAFRRSR